MTPRAQSRRNSLERLPRYARKKAFEALTFRVKTRNRLCHVAKGAHNMTHTQISTDEDLSLFSKHPSDSLSLFLSLSAASFFLSCSGLFVQLPAQLYDLSSFSAVCTSIV
ncbi:predicted protein [Plenodomus lingam JN3]|uniref:Predicted protein n=1 Tax=Leptosphaeria maculans (strain JN3 / isolate v23.1.3 / race Av1-4-5-6-7-8) TaxID=985895 RepID=E5R4F0_LEPMJ|nr:predicted protein [Plenodomus lingam JN3]CBX91918.1 predicted protein [Plenodomus lingam JN3]